MKKKSYAYILGILGSFCLLSSCYYDNGEDLYQNLGPTPCDTSEVSYINFVVPLLERLCINCHMGNMPSGAINLENYPSVLARVNSGILMGAIRHDPGFSPMPRGGNKIPACDIEQLQAWINQGAKDN